MKCVNSKTNACPEGNSLETHNPEPAGPGGERARAFASGLWETIGEDNKAELESVRFEAGVEAMACAP